VIVATQVSENYLESFHEFEEGATGHDLPWLRTLRSEAFERFCEVWFPTTHDEDWRFTNVSAIARTPFRLIPNGRFRLSQGDLEPYRVAGVGHQLVFVNGRFVRELSLLGTLPDGVEAGSLAEQISAHPETIQSHLGRYPDLGRNAFSALNTAFLEDGAYVHIRKGAVVEDPICLLFVSTGDGTPSMSHPRNLIVAEENSHATFVEDYVSLDDGAVFSNTVTVLAAGEHSVLSHYMIERENNRAFNVSTLRIQQGRSADIASHSVLLGGALVRNNVHPVLAGEGGECLINGLFIGTGDQHLDNYMLVEHASPRCASRQFYNGILDGHASGVFHGRIIVHPEAQKTDAKQTNRNLLLSDSAQINTKPQLEIYADDVKCTHGATIGQIETDALFYLRSRGIDEVSARKLLLAAFAAECLDRMKPGPVRRHVEGLINSSLSEIAESAIAESAPGALAGNGEDAGRNWEENG
jgi:Fe-S cluster assembly protein SufD